MARLHYRLSDLPLGRPGTIVRSHTDGCPVASVLPSGNLHLLQITRPRMICSESRVNFPVTLMPAYDSHRIGAYAGGEFLTPTPLTCQSR